MMNNLFLPPEWSIQKSVWLSWPHNLDTWSKEILIEVEKEYCLFVRQLSFVTTVNVCVLDENHKIFIIKQLVKFEANIEGVNFHVVRTNDAWMRDHGPDFVFDDLAKQKVILNWRYNAWGGKYPPFDLDNEVPIKIADITSLDLLSIKMVLEGGSFEVNGEGDLLTTKSCLLNPNRNPSLSIGQIESKLKKYLGVKKVHWLEQGISGDDTDGHIDDFARFVSKDVIVYCSTPDVDHPDYHTLKLIEGQLQNLVLNNGSKPKLIKLPLPSILMFEGEVLPCSYANFLITNDLVLVPVYGCDNDILAINILKDVFLNRKIVGIPSNNIILGLGSLHCLSKHEFDECQFVKS